MRKSLVVPLVLLFTAGCYHATVDTGLPASGEGINKSFASGWIYVLIPPATIENAA